MPQRFLRPGITDSDRWNSISFAAQSLFIRLLTRVDDYGRYDGRASVICGHCFSVWNDKNPKSAINPQESAALSCELMRAGLITIYEAEGKTVLQVEQWQERIREGAKEKWPSAQNPLRNPAESCGILPPSPPPSFKSSTAKSRLAGEKEFMELCKTAIGPNGSANWGGRWRNLFRSDPGKARRAIETTISDSKEKQIDNPGGYAFDLYQRFK